jgi:lipopolysaccharide assembly outer membrane protein LptD (OstA)
MIAVAAALALVCAGIMAQQQETKSPAPAEAAKKKEPENVLGRADFTRTAWGEKKTVLMKGNVKFTHEDTVLTSDQVEYDENAKTAISPGKVHITNPECDLTADKGTAYFKKKLGVVESNVVMILTPKRSEEESADKESIRAKVKQPTTITCDKLEYLYKDKIATAIGQVVFKQEKRTAHADKAVYDQNKEQVTLVGNVSGIDEYGQTFSAPGKVVISIKKGDEWMEAPNATATFKVDTEEETGTKP